MIRVGLAGLGIHGARYARHLLRGDVPGMTLTAVSRADEGAGRAFAAEHGLAFVREPEGLVADPRVDAVVVVLPPDLHARVARASLDAGKPVLVEKPLAVDAVQAGALARRVADGGGTLMVAHTLRFDPLILRLRELAQDLAPLRTVSINQRFDPVGRPWLDTPGRGGILLNTAVHGFDLLRFLTGAEPVSVVAETRRHGTRDTEDTCACLVALEPGGLVGAVENCRATASRSGRVEITGAGGQLCADHVHRRLVRIEGRREEDLGSFPPADTIAETLKAFAAAARGEASPAVTVHDGAAAVRLAEAARRSAESGRREPVPGPDA